MLIGVPHSRPNKENRDRPVGRSLVLCWHISDVVSQGGIFQVASVDVPELLPKRYPVAKKDTVETVSFCLC